ncbi:UvrD-helicase domain-containing protein [Chryseobacterium schmidteae]|uniref:UvrD-helicase domain-containing protein n=1 Tax=Chryseobacterium schmidteae TaxID=2730404 RepID=UPI00158C28E1|nr:UvrD-helicase domain-containing protein [Chryseobacterium schmidteae]
MNLKFTPTDEQKSIFSFFKTNLENGIIDAVAGSGKTTTLINGVEFIDTKLKILFCAFNKKIKNEIESKTRHYNNVTIKTTYSLGLNILKNNNKIFKNPIIIGDKYYNILDRYLDKTPLNDRKQILVQESFESLKLSFNDRKNKEKEQELPNENGEAKEDELSFYEIVTKNFKQLLSLTRLTLSFDSGEIGIKKIIEFYGLDIQIDDSNEIKHYHTIIRIVLMEGFDNALKKGEIDYSDMIFLPNHLNYNSSYKYDVIFIDECQDLSNAQLKTVLKFYKSNTGRIFAVGDPFQSIYGFAGASPKSFDNIKKIINPQSFKLTNCFRSAKSIVKLASEIRTDITTTNFSEGEVININYNEIIKFISNGDFVLSRFNKDIIFTFFILLRNGFSCKILGKEEILKEISEFIPKNQHYSSEFYSNLEDNVTNICKKYEHKFKGNSEKIVKAEGVRDIIILCYYEFQNSSNFAELLEYLKKFLDRDDEDSIILSSIHRSKGLESENVFILNYSLLPFRPQNAFQPEWQSYQENCLKYVAITRAQNKLYLVKENNSQNDLNSLRKVNEIIDDKNERFEISLDEIDDLPL